MSDLKPDTSPSSSQSPAPELASLIAPEPFSYQQFFASSDTAQMRYVLSTLNSINARLTNLEKAMSATTDALAALSTLETQLESDENLEETELASLGAEVTALKAQLATATTEDDSAAVAAITAKISTLDAKIQAATAAATSAAASTPTAPSEQ